MSLAQLFFMKETFRERVRRWRRACFRQRSASLVSRRSSLDCSDISRFTFHASRFLLETLEPRLLLSVTPTDIITPQELTTAAITVPAGSLPSLDVDLNGQADALSDGIVIIRHLFGFTGNALVDGAVDPAGQRTDPTAIANYLNSIRTTALDVDLNQNADALSDGILIIRSLFGFTGTALTDGAVDPGGQRTDPTVIATFLNNMNPQRELIAPLVTAGLQQDTGISATDSITFNPTIIGTMADINQIASFTAGFDTTPLANFTNVLTDLQATGTFTLSASRLTQVAGGTLADGAHTLHLRATDARGNVAVVDRTFTLDTTLPAATFNLASGSDTAPIGDLQTLFAVVALTGQTEPTAVVTLLQGNVTASIDQSGAFSINNVPLALGGNPLTIRVTDRAGNFAEVTRTFTRLQSTNQPPVLSSIGNQTIRAGELLRVTTSVSDADVPAQALSFSLVGTAPQGVSIGASTGVLTWTPTAAQIGQSSITVRVQDSGVPFLSDEKTFTITVAGANRAPVLAPIAPLTVFPGGHLEAPFTATDPDGDRVQFFVTSAAPLPTSMLNGSGTFIITPAPGEEGTYTFTVIASDGVLTSTQAVTLAVAPDPNATTRISGKVVGTTGQPLAGVPIEVGRIITLTAADGTFTLDLPAILVPTASFNITIPTGDVFFDPFNTGTQFISMRRAGSDPATGTSTTNPLEHPNLVSSFLDGNIVYGSDADRALALRSLQGGKLKTSAGNLLPFNTTAFFPGGPLDNDNASNSDPGSLFVAGDVRASENVALEAIHIILVREHNRLADVIAAATAGLSDEAIYQQARRWLVGELQHIIYSEYLPVLLGPNAISTYAGYNGAADPAVSALFTTAAFRFGHSQMVSSLLQLDAAGTPLPGGPLNLRDAFFTTAPITTDGIDPILRGLLVQQAQNIDSHVVDELRNFLFGPPGSGGQDLVSLNIQRGRDMGLPSYTQARLDFGLSPITRFDQITSDVAAQQMLQSVYGTVDKIDVWVGGITEDHVAGALVGPLFQKILAEQFTRTRAADRFWYENSQFTASELAQIRSTTFGALLARNSGLTNLPSNVFTTNTPPTGPAPAGTAAATAPTQFRSVDGSGNNLTMPTLGQTGTDLKTNFTVSYGDGISTPGGADRPGAREISNAVFPQTESIPNTQGATALAIFFGQILDHDLSLTATGITDTMKIHGDQATPANTYPFVAEKLPLMLGHQVYAGLNNVIARPIFLPAIDVANAVTINPTQDVMVKTSAIPGASVAVTAGTLEDREGNMFTGQLSITRVPSTLTPASLPAGLNPDLVVTIQPADMVFTNPAPLSLPNSGGFAPGTIMDLWSINPLTGQFDNVGKGQVSQDGTVIETVSGGVRNSSWHFFAPPPVSTSPTDHSEECEECNAKAGFNSDVELGSGAVIESQTLPSYQSLGVDRGVQLIYDSLRADPSQIIQIGQNAVLFDPSEYFVGKLEIGHRDPDGTFTGSTVPGGVMPGQGSTGWQFWRVPDFGDTRFGVGVGNLEAAMLADLTAMPTGLYDYRATYGLQNHRPQETIGSTNFSERFVGSTSSFWGDLVSVNEISSPFGAGWGIAGFQKLVATGLDVILVDGDGSHLLYRANTTGEVGTFNTGADQRTPIATSFTSPPGHFATLTPLFQDVPSGSGFARQLTGYRQTLTDQTVSTFDATGKLLTVHDRNGNTTTYEYNVGGQLTRIVDPVGLATTFAYNGNRVSTITDPANRVTQLTYDAAGNLLRITNPDNTARQWDYDARHHMIGETDQRGNREETFYDFAGRAAGAVLKDGGKITLTPRDVLGLSDPHLTSDWHTAPTARDRTTALDNAQYVAPNGNVMVTQLDDMGQTLRSFDSLGALSSTARNAENQVIQTADALGHATQYAYDERGNLTGIRDALSGGSRVSGTLMPAIPVAFYSLTLDHYTNLFFDSLTNRNDVMWTLRSQTGVPLVSFRPFSSAAPLPKGGSHILSLLEPGTYSLLVQGTSGTADAFSFRLIDVDEAIPIPFGTPISGTLSPGNEGDLYRFSASAGDHLSLDAISSAGFAAPFTWQLVDEGGFPVFTQGFADLSSVTVPVTGTYTLLIEGDIAETTQNGAYSFSVQKLSSGPPAPAATPIAFGTTIAGNIGQAGEIDRFSFQVQAGTIVYLDDLGTGTNIQAAIFTERLGNSSLPIAAGLPDGILRNLPGPGTYTLAVSGVGAATGSYQFRLLNLASATPVTVGTAVAGTLTPGFETDLYAINIPLDGPYRLDLTAQPTSGFTAAPILYVVDQSGKVLQTTTLPGVGQPPIQITKDSLSGTLYLIIEGAATESSPSGTYSVTPILTRQAVPSLSSFILQPITIGALVSGQVAGPNELDRYVVQGTFGQRLLFVGVSTTASALGVQIQTTLINDPFTSGGVIRPFTVSQTGGVTITIGGSFATAGTYSFRVLDLAAARPLTLGAVKTGQMNSGTGVEMLSFTGTIGQQVTLNNLSSSSPTARWRLIAPNDTVLSSGLLSEDLGSATLTLDGTYVLLIEGGSPSASTVAYSIRADVVNPTMVTPSGFNIISGIAPVQGFDTYQVTASAGTLLYLYDLQNAIVDVTIQAPTGEFVGGGQGFNHNGYAPVFLPKSGTYNVQIHRAGQISDGIYRFRILNVTNDSTAITIGNTISHQFAAEEVTAAFRVTVSAGQRLYFDDLVPGGSNVSRFWYAADGTFMPIGDLHRFLLPGTYYMLARNQSFSQTSTYQFRLLDLATAPGILFDSTVSAASTTGLEAELYQFDVTSVQIVRVSSLSTSGVTNARWGLTDGSTSNGLVKSVTDSIDTILLPGTHWLIVDGNQGTPYSYSFSVTLMPIPALGIPQLITTHGQDNQATGQGTLFTYDPVFSQVTSITDELGHQTLFDIDPANGNIRSITGVVGALGGGDDVTTQLTYTAQGLVDLVTDALGRVTDYDYNLFGRLTLVTYAKGTTEQGVQKFEYDSAGNVTAFIDENNHRTEFAYDSMNRLTLTRDALLHETGFAYDAAGNLIRTTDARTNQTTDTYDVRNRLISMTDANNDVTRYAYDADNNLVSMADPLGHQTIYEYDLRDRLVKAVDPAAGATRFGHDGNNNLTSLVDPAGNTTYFAYDARDRMVRQTDPLGNSSRYQFDAINDLIGMIDRNGEAIVFAYDDLDRLNTETWVGGGNVVTSQYDKVGNLTSLLDQFSKLSFTYDNRNRVKVVDNQGTPNVPRVALNYVYDGAGNLLEMDDAINGTAAGVTAYLYDGANRMTRTTQSGNGVTGKRVNFGYNEVNQFASIDRYADVAGTNLVAKTAYSYDALNRLTNKTHRNAANTLLDQFQIEYDAASRVAKTTDIDGSTDYNYDARDQLTAADHAAAGNPDETYQYDANGNRVSSSLHGTGYVTGPGNRLQSDGTFNYVYDGKGNLVRRTEIATGTVREFDWDQRGRLVELDDRAGVGQAATQVVTYTYDALNRRIGKSVDADGAGAGLPKATLFVYDRDNVTLEFVDTDGAAGPASATLNRRNLHGPAVDQILAQQDAAGNIFWMLTDHVGTVKDVVNNSGTVINHMVYDAFGNVVSQTNSAVETRYRFTGREFDAESQLYYYRARYYDAGLGRFISEDPLGFRGGDLNLFGYTSNDPILFTDSSGTADVVFFGDTNPQKILKEAYEKFKKTKHGATQCKALEKLPGKVIISPTKGPSHYDPNTGEVLINVTDPELTVTTKGPQATPIEVKIGHEIGHVTGTSDSGRGQMDNVRTNENPIRRELGLPPRIQY
jgi:RHS repeat-associated protein